MMSEDERDLTARLNVSGFLQGLGVASILYLIPIFLEELGASYTEIGFIGGVRAAPYAFLPIAAGYLADRLDKSKLYLMSAFFAAAGAALLYPSQALLDAALANLLIGTHMVFYWPVAEAIIAEALSESARWSAYTRFSVAWSLAYLTGPLIGGFLATVLGLRGVFLLAAILSGLAVPVIASMGRLEPAARPRSKPIGKRAVLTLSPLYLSALIFTIGLASLLALAPPYLQDLDWGVAGIGALFAGFGAARAAAYFALSRSGRLPTTPLLLSAAAAEALSLALISTGAPIPILLALPLFGAVNGAYFTAAFDVLSRRAPEGLRGLAIGLFEAIIGVGFIAGPVAAGPLMDLMGASETFWALSLLSLLGAPFSLILGRAPRSGG